MASELNKMLSRELDKDDTIWANSHTGNAVIWFVQ